MKRDKIYMSTYMRTRRQKLKELGICPVCGVRKKMYDFSMCQHCHDVQKAYREKIRGIYRNAKQ